MKFLILLFILLLLIGMDKALTVANILMVNKNFPEQMKGDYYHIEKNPLAKWFFHKNGLFGGTILYGIVSILTLFAFYGVFRLLTFNSQTSLYVIFMLYGLVIFNNLFFLFKYSRIIS